MIADLYRGSPTDRCPDCDAGFGDTHVVGCDVEHCTVCGLQVLIHDVIGPPGGGRHGACPGHDPEIACWFGTWPGIVTAAARGWWMGDPESGVPDLNRVAAERARRIRAS